MNARVNIELARCLSRELHSVSRSVLRLNQEIEEVERILKRQTEFDDCLRALRKVRQQTGEEQCGLSILAQGLENIAQLYSGTEQEVQENFDPALKFRPVDIKVRVCTEQRRRILTKIYGG